MSDFIPPALPGPNNAVRSTSVKSDSETLAARTPLWLKVGMRLEIQLAQKLSSTLIEVRLRPMEGNVAWSAATRVQLAAPLPDLLSHRLSTMAETRSTTVNALCTDAEVVSISPTLTLRIRSRAEQAPACGAPSPTAGSREWLNCQLRQNLPQSRPLLTTLEGWIARLNHPSGIDERSLGTSSPTTNATQRMIETLVGGLATAKELVDPERLSSSLNQSGIWLEALMAQTATNSAHSSDFSLDLKAQLLRLAELIRTADRASPPAGQPAQHRATGPKRVSPTALPPEPGEPENARNLERPPAPNHPQFRSAIPEPNHVTKSPHGQTSTPPTAVSSTLAREVDGMIKQIVTHQLQSLETGIEQPQWMLELPFKTPTGLTALEADIRRESGTSRSEDESWSMRIRLNLPRLGSLSINLNLKTDRLNAGLQAETEAGADILRTHLDILRQQLVARNIEVASLHASYQPSGGAQNPQRPPMVSERA